MSRTRHLHRIGFGIMTGLGSDAHVVVVGASAAGLSAADGLREGGFDGSITVLSSERHDPYDRPTLSKGLLWDQGDPVLLHLRSTEQISDSRINLMLGRGAVGLDIDRKYVVTDHGDALPWDAVVLACGGRLDAALGGLDADDVHEVPARLAGLGDVRHGRRRAPGPGNATAGHLT